MSIPSTFAPVYPQDFTLNPVKVHKSFTVSGSEFQTTSSGYYLLEGYYTTKKTPIGTDEVLNDPVNSVDNSYKHIIWKSVDNMYYRNPYDQSRTFEHWNKRFSYKFLNVTCSIISIPYLDYGERIVKESVTITNPDLGIVLRDDGYGNLYDVAVQDDLFSSSHMDRRYLLGYWGFNDLYRKFKYNFGTIRNGEGYYASSHFTPNQTYKIKNVTFSGGVDISGSSSGIAAEFTGNGEFIQIHNRKEFNFDNIDQFTLSFWVYVAGTGTGSIISKRGTIYKDTFGYQNKVLGTTGNVVRSKYISSSFVDEAIDRYPFDISYSGSNIYFRRSDGIHTINLSGSLTTGSWNHISAVRHLNGETGYCALFVNNQFKQQALDETLNPINDHEILIGTTNQAGASSFTGKVDEIRLYNYSFITGSNISGSTLHTNLYNTRYLYNTSVVGNVFYRRGNIVISSPDPTYSNMLSGSSWYMSYDGTHTIYTYEILCRIRKGSFALTMNPTARKSPKSDLLMNEMTGSFLTPYYTTIGLYSDSGDLLAVGKCGQAVAINPEVDVNWIIRFDA